MLSKLKFYFITAVLAGANILAQDSTKRDVQITETHRTTSYWYTDYWVWIIGGLVFLFLLVAILLASSRSDGGTTVIKESKR